MKAIPSLTLVLGALLPLLPAAAEMREFKSARGSTIRAELVKAKGQTIILKSDAGKELQVPLASFSLEDQNAILKWMAEDPWAIDYHFTCKAEEKLLKDTKVAGRGYGERYAAVQKIFDVSVLNGSRNAIDNLTLEWRVFLLNRVDPSGSAATITADQVFFKSGTEAMPVLNFNGTFRFRTKPYVLHSIKETYQTGRVEKDRLLGVWVRIFRLGQVVGEWKSQGTPKCEWPEVAGNPQTTDPAPPPAGTDTPEAGKPSATPDTPPSPPAATPRTSPPATPPDKDGKPAVDDDSDATLLKIFELDDGPKK